MAILGSGQEAHQALVRLLAKLELIETKLALKSYQEEDCCPITHFAHEGCFEESDAIGIVAERLGIKVAPIEVRNALHLHNLLENPTLSCIPLERWKTMRAIPIELNDQGLVVAMANPLDQETLKALRLELGFRIMECIASEGAILEILSKKSSPNQAFDLDSLVGKVDSEGLKVAAQDLLRQESNVGEENVTAPPIIRVVNQILATAIQADASDIHLNPEKDGLSVRLRVDGIIQPLIVIPNTVKNAVVSRIKLLGGMDIAEKRKPQDGRLRIKLGIETRDLRLSSVPTIYGENVVIRVLSSDLNKITFDNLGVTSEMQKMFRRALTGSSRVFLVTGPTGSGKTSTLYASLLNLRDGKTNIITIEDPIEYRIPGINQIQVNNKIGVTFAEGLRSVLRQDPDTIMVGEIRDYDTCSIALQAAQTGHLVLSTIHTNTAASAVVRMRDLGVPPYIIASALGCVVAQRLVRRLCPRCSKPLEEKDLSLYEKLHLDPNSLRIPVGCELCRGTGYKGRIGIFSFLEVNDAVRQAIREELPEEEIESCSRSLGFRSLTESALEMLNGGVTSVEEVERSMGPLESLDAGFAKHPDQTAQQAPPAKTVPDTFTIPRAPAPGITLAKRRILIVEDDENTRTVVQLLLQREMFEVETAENGLQGLEKIYQNPPHLIVCDYMMPTMNGLEMIQKLRRDQRMRDIPVLMLTAADSEQNEIQVLDSGADDFVSKASDTKVMISRIHRLLGRASELP